jgi:hypothetical protein
MIKKTDDKIKVDGSNGIEEYFIYEKIVKTKILVNKPLLLKRKDELQAELDQINLDLSQIVDDEKNDI